MGLDMFFYAVYKNENGTSQGRKEAIYWRKANAIFRWFNYHLASVGPDGLKNCVDYDVTRDEMTTLRDVCKTVLEKRDRDYSKKNLPTQGGFFFGSLDYNDGYYYDVEQTVKGLDELLANPSVVGGVFHAWW